jgi:hypothetical protein
MTTMTKNKKTPLGKGTYNFWTTGEGMTDLIRDAWISDTPKHALKICKDSLGMTTEQALEVITGKKKLIGDTREGDGTLDWADDNTTQVSGIELSVEVMVTRLENKYIDASEAINLFNNGAERIVDKIRYVDADSDFLNDDLKHNDGNINYYKKRISDAIEQLEVVYPLVGKSMKDLPLNKVRSAARLIKNARAEQMKDDFEENKPTKELINETFSRKVENIDTEKLSDKELEDIDEEVKKEVIDKTDITRAFTTAMGGGRFYIVHTPVEKCKSEGMNSGWLLPDGTFYGGDSAWIHRGILEELDERGFFKDKSYGYDEDDVQDNGGWIKISGGDWAIWEHKHKLTKEQVEFIIEYTTVVRERTYFTINTFHKIHIQVFADMLNGREFNSFKMAEESKPIIDAEEEVEKNNKNNPLANFPTIDEVSNIDPLSTPFFQPDADFVKWLIKYANGRMIIDCGAGSGYLTALIHHLGYNKCIAIEPHYTEERNIFWRKRGFQFHVFFKRSEEEAIIRDIPDGKALLIFARPCHSSFVYDTIKKNMSVGMEALYISHKHNTMLDLRDIKYTELKHEGTSKSNEFVLSIKK